MKALGLTVRFACELAMLVAVGWWGWSHSVAEAVLWPLGVIGVWSSWIAPKARHRLRDPARLVLELVLFAAATAAFVAVGQTVVAVIFAVAAVATALPARRAGV